MSEADSLLYLADTYFEGDWQAAERWGGEVNTLPAYERLQRVAALAVLGEAYPSDLPPYPFMVEWAAREGIPLP